MVIVAVAVPPPSPASEALNDDCTVKLPLEVPGVNFSPAFPSAKVMKSPLLMTVVPLFLNSVPPVIPVILKWVTSGPSAGLREITSPEVVWVFALVVAFVTEGVSATAVMLKLTVAGALVFGSATPLVVPLSSTVYWKLAAPLKSAVGVNTTLPPTMLTVPPKGLLTVLTTKVWPLSLAGPVESLAVKVENGIVRGPESSATLESVSPTAVGASFTSVMTKWTNADALVFGSATPFVVPLSSTVYWKVAVPLKLAAGVKRTVPATMLTVPPTGLLTVLTVRVWPLSLAGPFESLLSSVLNWIVRGPESSATLESTSFTAVGASFTSVMLKLAVALPLVFGSATPLVVPLSSTVYWKLAGPL